MNIHRHALVALSAVAVLAASPVMAAPPATPSYGAGEAIKEAQPPKPPVEREQAAPVLPQMPEPPLSLPDGQTLHVSDFRLDGVTAFDPAEIAALLAPYGDRDLSMADIDDAANRITTYYRSRGYFVAKAYVPQQDASDGILTIQVVEGRYGKLRVNNASHVQDFLVEGTLDSAASGSETITSDAMNRAMLLISDMPGARMPTLTIAPGTRQGTTDFTLDAPAGNRIEGYAMADNFGSRYSGRNRLNLGLDVNAPTGMADKLSLVGGTSEGSGLQTGSATYSALLTYSGLRGEVSAGRTTYELGDIYRDLDAQGYADTIEGRLTYPIIRSHEETLRATLAAGFRRLQDKIWDETISQRKARLLRAGLSNQTNGTMFGLPTRTEASAVYTLGKLTFDDSDELAQNKAGANTANDYAKLEIGLSANITLDDPWSVQSSLKLQKALMDKNLDSSEQMSASGPDAVTGYPVGIMGDNGYVYNAELRYSLPTLGDIYRHMLGTYFEVGRVYLQNDDYTTGPHATRISDIGLSYAATIEYMDERYLFTKVQLSQGIGPRPEGGEHTARTKVLGQVGVTF